MLVSQGGFTWRAQRWPVRSPALGRYTGSAMELAVRLASPIGVVPVMAILAMRSVKQRQQRRERCIFCTKGRHFVQRPLGNDYLVVLAGATAGVLPPLAAPAGAEAVAGAGAAIPLRMNSAWSIFSKASL